MRCTRLASVLSGLNSELRVVAGDRGIDLLAIPTIGKDNPPDRSAGGEVVVDLTICIELTKDLYSSSRVANLNTVAGEHIPPPPLPKLALGMTM